MMTGISVRYIVDDLDAAVDFYTGHLQFEVSMRPGPGFAMLRRGDLRLLLNVPGGGGGAGQQLADGSTPAPGGWNRFQVQVDDLDTAVAELRQAGVDFRGDTITGRGGRQALAVDPSGNLVELFEAYQG
jgi:catechol 2,3-dioxygenase-like lactoylglutathione lyase family enzyme